MISLVVPTFNEAGGIEEALRRSTAALARLGDRFELIVVDDASPDGTAERAEALTRELPVRVLRRVGKRGLATAVVDGWGMAEGDVLGVMDADLQHPPEVLADLARALQTSGADLALASRYTVGGGSRDWSPIRRFISWAATHLAASVLPLKLGNVTDPMSGMFMVRAEAIRGIQLQPLGYKILLEVLGKGRIRQTVEVPYRFEERARGRSKLGARQYVEYLAHLLRLAHSTGQLRRWVRYVLVGLTGAAVELAWAVVAIEHWGWSPLAALPAAVELALVCNFLGNGLFTFSRMPNGRGLAHRLVRYEAICLPGAILNAFLALAMIARGLPLVAAVAAGIIADGLINLLFNIPSIWRIWSSA
jgi:dolichol-phosphate mannosyltransferase